MEIINASTTKDGRKQLLDIVGAYEIFDSNWNAFGRFRNAMEAIYKKYDPTFDLPQFKTEAYGLDRTYTIDHGYLLLKIDTASEYNAVRIVGFSPFFEAYKEHVEEHSTESTYYFILDCIQDILRVAQKMLSLPIFYSNHLIFSSLMYHYYLDYRIDSGPWLKHIMNARTGCIFDDFKRMIFETNGANPLSVRGNLPILSNFAWNSSRGYYRWRESDPSSFVKDMKSNKALNLRKAFAEMEKRLSQIPESTEEEMEDEIAFTCTVGVCTQKPHYDSQKKFPGISTYPVVSLTDSLQLGIFSTCMDPRRYDYAEMYIGWIDYTSGISVYGTHEQVFRYLEDDIVGTLEDNYNFLLEKLPDLRKDRLRKDMLEYIIEGLQAFFLFYRTLKRSFFIL